MPAPVKATTRFALPIRSAKVLPFDKGLPPSSNALRLDQVIPIRLDDSPFVAFDPAQQGHAGDERAGKPEEIAAVNVTKEEDLAPVSPFP
jgi:hypothetical protein